MSISPIDILYTPLDVPARPDVDIKQFRNWCTSIYPQPFRGIDPYSATAERNLKDMYPWDLVYAYLASSGWQSGFDTEFPDLARYCYEGFGIDKDDISGIVILPLRSTKMGIGFWHTDIDPYALRFYIECESPDENPLLMKRTRIPYDVMQPFTAPVDEHDSRLQTEILTCKIMSPTQSNYLNNIRAVHTPYISKLGTNRICVLIGPKRDRIQKIYDATKDLIVRSAIKYKDYSILWEPEQANEPFSNF